jgi:2-haloacid dehalogenase/putative hydrolase of the HAD superfamily
MTKAIFLDFYGTAVHEDDVIIHEITERIYRSSPAANPSEISHYWWRCFSELCNNSYGDTF